MSDERTVIKASEWEARNQDSRIIVDMFNLRNLRHEGTTSQNGVTEGRKERVRRSLEEVGSESMIRTPRSATGADTH